MSADHDTHCVAVVILAILQHVSIDGREPTLDEAKHLYARWFSVDLDNEVVA